MKKFGLVLLLLLTTNIYSETTNGHTLPPEPDPKINNSTLLGIDSNNNGVRDDVERWIYKTYKDKHPIHIDIAMQASRAYKKVLETPERAKEIHNIVSAHSNCEGYFRVFADRFGDTKYIQKKILGTKFDNIYFNISEMNFISMILQQYFTLSVLAKTGPFLVLAFCHLIFPLLSASIIFFH